MVFEKTVQRPSDCKQSNYSILKEINPEYSEEGLMLKLKRMKWLDGIIDPMDMSLSRLQ